MKIIQELAKMLRFNVKEILDDNGCFMKISELPDDVATMLSEIKITEKFGLEGEVIPESLKGDFTIDFVFEIKKLLKNVEGTIT